MSDSIVAAIWFTVYGAVLAALLLWLLLGRRRPVRAAEPVGATEEYADELHALRDQLAAEPQPVLLRPDPLSPLHRVPLDDHAPEYTRLAGRMPELDREVMTIGWSVDRIEAALRKARERQTAGAA